MDKLETEFTKDLLENISQAEILTGIPEKRLTGRILSLGGQRAMKSYLTSGQTTRQFSRLKELGRLDLTPEYLATKGKYSPLFTDEEANLCLEILLEAGAF